MSPVAGQRNAEPEAREQKLKLAVIDRAPFSLWACDKNHRIVLWSAACEQIYGIRREDAIGQNFIELFVDLPEREQAAIDCRRVIDDDYVQRNFLAYDVAKSGARRTMLTNCFRVWDEERREYVQAEVALEISDLHLRVDELRTLREAGIKRLAERARTVELVRRNLMSRLTQHQTQKVVLLNQRQVEFNEFKAAVRRASGSTRAEEVTRQQQESLQRARDALDRAYTSLMARISSAVSLEELDAVEPELIQFGDAPYELGDSKPS